MAQHQLCGCSLRAHKCGNGFPHDVGFPLFLRSFLHHFYPAYDAAIVDYASKVEKQTQLVEK